MMQRLIQFLVPETSRQVLWQFVIFCGLAVALDLFRNGGFPWQGSTAFVSMVFDSSFTVLPLGLLYSAIALHHVTELERLYISARYDPLSGVLNRQTFLRRVRRSLQLSHRGMLLVIDADFFKRVNDDFGHATGDECIKAIGHRLSWHLRDSDFAGRIGGEEFAVFLPDVTQEHGRLVATRLGMPVSFTGANGERNLSITLSIGAVWTTSEENADTFLMEADEALYRAKTTGRARIIISDEDEPILLGRLNGVSCPDQQTRRRVTSRSEVA